MERAFYHGSLGRYNFLKIRNEQFTLSSSSQHDPQLLFFYIFLDLIVISLGFNFLFDFKISFE